MDINTQLIHGQAAIVSNVDVERIKFASMPLVTDEGIKRLGDMEFLYRAIEKALERVIKNPPTPRKVRDDFIVIEVNYGGMTPKKTNEFFKELCKILDESKFAERLYLYGEDMLSRGFQIYKENPTITYIRYGVKASAGETK